MLNGKAFLFCPVLLLTSVKTPRCVCVCVIRPDEPSRAAPDSWHSRAMTAGFKWHDSSEIKANIFSPAKLTRFFPGVSMHTQGLPVL